MQNREGRSERIRMGEYSMEIVLLRRISTRLLAVPSFCSSICFLYENSVPDAFSTSRVYLRWVPFELWIFKDEEDIISRRGGALLFKQLLS